MKWIEQLESERNFYRFALLCSFILIIGMTCNFLAIKNNKGLMPIHNGLSDKEHIDFIQKSEINNWYLCDIVRFKAYVYSIGDLVMILAALGIFLNIIYFGVKVYILRNEHG
jgi:hypothetical protein